MSPLPPSKSSSPPQICKSCHAILTKLCPLLPLPPSTPDSTLVLCSLCLNTLKTSVLEGIICESLRYALLCYTRGDDNSTNTTTSTADISNADRNATENEEDEEENIYTSLSNLSPNLKKICMQSIHKVTTTVPPVICVNYVGFVGGGLCGFDFNGRNSGVDMGDVMDVVDKSEDSNGIVNGDVMVKVKKVRSDPDDVEGVNPFKAVKKVRSDPDDVIGINPFASNSTLPQTQTHNNQNNHNRNNSNNKHALSLHTVNVKLNKDILKYTRNYRLYEYEVKVVIKRVVGEYIERVCNWYDSDSDCITDFVNDGSVQSKSKNVSESESDHTTTTTTTPLGIEDSKEESEEGTLSLFLSFNQNTTGPTCLNVTENNQFNVSRKREGRKSRFLTGVSNGGTSSSGGGGGDNEGDIGNDGNSGTNGTNGHGDSNSGAGAGEEAGVTLQGGSPPENLIKLLTLQSQNHQAQLSSLSSSSSLPSTTSSSSSSMLTPPSSSSVFRALDSILNTSTLEIDNNIGNGGKGKVKGRVNVNKRTSDGSVGGGGRGGGGGGVEGIGEGLKGVCNWFRDGYANVNNTTSTSTSTTSTSTTNSTPVSVSIKPSNLNYTPVYQDNFTAGNGNALAACIASLLHLPLSQIPNFIDPTLYPNGYIPGIERWLCKRGMYCEKCFTGTLDTLEKRLLFCGGGESLVVLRGKSTRYDGGHVVIGRVRVNTNVGNVDNVDNVGKTDNVGKAKTGNYEYIHDPYPNGTFFSQSVEEEEEEEEEEPSWILKIGFIQSHKSTVYSEVVQTIFPTHSHSHSHSHTLSLPVQVLPSFCLWRTNFYITGKYTKLRRDCPQTPFFVRENGRNIRLGISSVEDEIVGVVGGVVGGVRGENNFRVVSAASTSSSSSLSSNTPPSSVFTYAKIKFHASGREDMDVRMLCSHGLGGRPFCLEVIDARFIPTEGELDGGVRGINFHEFSSEDEDEMVSASDSYGHGPGGVGVSSLMVCGKEGFGGLQKETEDKVKHYSCLVHTFLPITSQTHLNTLNLTSTTPLQIHQQTPLRVLHRRAALTRTRVVLNTTAVYVNAHWFKLYLSTNAGTYVKEFVHGDMGRTVPSVAGIVGGVCDIVQLDCCGLDVKEEIVE